MSDIKIEFNDGTLYAMASVQTVGTTPRGVDEDGGIHTAASRVVLDIVSGRIVTENGEVPVEPGRYVITAEGLFREVDISAA